jgi:hypothetical protein
MSSNASTGPGDSADDRKSARHRSEANFREYGCRIDRDTLDRIISLSQKDFSPKASLEISTERKSSGISSRISAESIDQLLEGIRESTAAGDPNWIDNLKFFVTESYMEAYPLGGQFL